MCNFLSVLILRDGSVRHHPLLDSHSDLVRYFEISDTNAHIPHFAKAELTPVDWADAATWLWKIDERVRPIWLDDVEAAAEQETRAIAQRMVLKDVERTLIVDGTWIVAGNSKIRDVRSGWIRRVQDQATVSDVRDQATVSDVWGRATVSNVWGRATVSDVRDQATVSNVRDQARLDDSAKSRLAKSK